MERSIRIDHAERLLEDHGREVGPVRVAAGKSGFVVGFPRDPMVHISWLALAAVTALVVAIKRLRP